MTSLHVICGLGPPIKNPGYAYGPNLNGGTRPFYNLRTAYISIHWLLPCFITTVRYRYSAKSTPAAYS